MQDSKYQLLSQYYLLIDNGKSLESSQWPISLVLTVINMRSGIYTCGSALSDPWSWFHRLCSDNLLRTLHDCHGRLHLLNSITALLKGSFMSIFDFLCTQVVGLLLCWGMPFILCVEYDVTWMQVCFLSLWATNRRIIS